MNLLNTLRMYSICCRCPTVFDRFCCMFISWISFLAASFSRRVEPCCCLSSCSESSSCRTCDRNCTMPCHVTEAWYEDACCGMGCCWAAAADPSASPAGSSAREDGRGLDLGDRWLPASDAASRSDPKRE